MNKQEYLEEIEKVIENGPYKATWESLCGHETPKWYRQDKFGIFIHWGIYSVPAFGNEWYAHYVYKQGSPEFQYHKDNYGDLKAFGYKDFIPMFTAEKFCAEQWAELFKEAGARFVMPVAEHHDGFQMYESELSDWNAKKMGPGRDVLGELKTAVEKRDMKICASSHRAEHWWFFNRGRDFDCDVQDQAYQAFYGPACGPSHNWNTLYDYAPDEEFLEDWLVRSCEIVDKYRPKIMFFDWWIQVYAFKTYLQKFAAYYYNRAASWGTDVAIDAKFDAYVHGSAVKDIERGQLNHISPDFWQNDTSVAKNSWGYTKNNDYKDSVEIIQDLVDVVSKNGALLLNIGPKADGTIPKEDENILKEIGNWLKINGEAIYNTVYWKTFGEGPTEVPEGHFTDTQRKEYTPQDIRFTARANYIYATVMKWPVSGTVKIKSLGTGSGYFKSSIKDIEILETGEHPYYELRQDLEIYTTLYESSRPVCLKITID